MTWATSVPILVFLGLSVLELGTMYATDRQTDVRQKHRLMPPPYGGGGIIKYNDVQSPRGIISRPSMHHLTASVSDGTWFNITHAADTQLETKLSSQATTLADRRCHPACLYQSCSHDVQCKIEAAPPLRADGRVPDLQLGGCRFESRPGPLRTNVYSAFHPSGVGK